jgi:hypothetical protein
MAVCTAFSPVPPEQHRDDVRQADFEMSTVMLCVTMGVIGGLLWIIRDFHGKLPIDL